MKDYTLEKNRSIAKTCPCGKSNNSFKFVPIVGHPDKGWCFSCQKFFHPEEAPVFSTKAGDQNYPVMPEKNEKNVSYFDTDPFIKSIGKYSKNTLFLFLRMLTNPAKAEMAAKHYYLGTSNHWSGSTVFWYLDVEGRVRSGKIIKYDIRDDPMSFIHLNCNRVNFPYVNVTWAHIVLKIKDFYFESCYFGEHLLKHYPYSEVCIVESEKSAIIASIFLPSYVWLASGGASGLGKGKIASLKGRKIILVPDLQKFDLWKKAAIEMREVLGDSNVRVSEFLERRANASERAAKLDIADFLIRDRFDFASSDYAI